METKQIAIKAGFAAGVLAISAGLTYAGLRFNTRWKAIAAKAAEAKASRVQEEPAKPEPMDLQQFEELVTQTLVNINATMASAKQTLVEAQALSERNQQVSQQLNQPQAEPAPKPKAKRRRHRKPAPQPATATLVIEDPAKSAPSLEDVAASRISSPAKGGSTIGELLGAQRVAQLKAAVNN